LEDCGACIIVLFFEACGSCLIYLVMPTGLLYCLFRRYLCCSVFPRLNPPPPFPSYTYRRMAHTLLMRAWKHGIYLSHNTIHTCTWHPPVDGDQFFHLQITKGFNVLQTRRVQTSASSAKMAMMVVGLRQRSSVHRCNLVSCNWTGRNTRAPGPKRRFSVTTYIRADGCYTRRSK
jgi:hypothetical protein